MRIRVTRTIPGLTNGVACTPGLEVDMPEGLAIALVGDGYAEMVEATAAGRAAPAERREVAARRAGRAQRGN